MIRKVAGVPTPWIEFEIAELFDDIGSAASEDFDLAETVGIAADDAEGSTEETPST